MVTARSRSLFAANRRTRNTQGNTDSCFPTALCFVGPCGARFGSIVPDRLIFLAVGDQDSRRVAVAVPGMLAGSILETVHLLRGQIFPLPQIDVARPTRLTVRFTMVEGPRMALGFCMVKVGFRKSTVRIMDILRKD